MDGEKEESMKTLIFFPYLIKLMMVLLTKIQNLSQFSGKDKFTIGYLEFESLIKHPDIWHMVGCVFQEHMENN